MQILFKGLWGAETARVDEAKTKVAEWTITNVYARREDCSAYKIVLIHTYPCQQAPMRIFLFVLKVCSNNVHRLVCLVVVTQGDVVQFVIIVLHSNSQLRGHKEKATEFV